MPDARCQSREPETQRPDSRSQRAADLGAYRTAADFPFVVRGDHVYMVVLDDDDVQYVARFLIDVP